MSRIRSNKRQPTGQGPVLTSSPRPGARATRTISLLVLVFVVFVVALLMVISLVKFVVNPDPAVRAGPMYVTLVLTTSAAMLMLVLALNASYLPFMSRRRVSDLQLIMLAMAVTGVVTGLLTVGGAANPFVMRLIIGGMAFVFISMQNTRLTRAREAAPTGQAAQPAPQARPRPRGRQRRGGRKR